MRPLSAMSDEDRRWRGRSDARTLAEAEAIKLDKEREANAKAQAMELLKEQSAELKGLSKVVGKKVANTPTDHYTSPFSSNPRGNKATLGRL